MLVLVTALAVVAAPVAAASPSPGPPTTGPGVSSPEADPERAAQVEAGRRREGVEAELELLRRSDAELEAELARLDAEIRTLEGRTVAARSELAELQGRLVGLRSELAVAEVRAAEQHDRLVERAIAAYIDPAPQLSMLVLTDADLGDLGRRKVLLDVVTSRDRAVLDEMLAAESAVRAARDETGVAEARAAELATGLEADADSVRARRERQLAVEAALDDRIGDFQREADALAAEEGRLARLLAQREAERATTTTVAPTTTSTAPTTSTTRPGVTTTTTEGRSSTTSSSTTRPPSTTTTTRPPGVSMVWPTPGPVTSGFGPRWGRMHNGIDIGAPVGQAIVAAAGGVVFFAGEMGGYGNLVMIDHGGGIVTFYAHQSSIAASDGASVSQGQTIGYVGNTGHSTGPHLHFEVRVGGTAVDPIPYLR